MCVTALPGVELSGTIILLGEDPISKRRYIHYRNNVTTAPNVVRREPVQNILRRPAVPSRWQFEETKGPQYINMMFWPIFGEFESIGVRDAKSAPLALEDVDRALTPPKALSLGPVTRSKSVAPDREYLLVETEFYTTLVAKDPAIIPDVLGEKAIQLPTGGSKFADVLGKFQRAYPETPVALNLMKPIASTGKSAAVLLTFKPMPGFEDILFAPTLDGHGFLDFAAVVNTDHTIAVACEHGVPVTYRNWDQIEPGVQACLPKRVLGVKFKKRLPNGDFIFSKGQIDAGEFLGRRVLPFGLDPRQFPMQNFDLTLQGPVLANG